MRVTSIIKDYITNEIDKKYQKKLQSIPNEYQEQRNKCIIEMDKLLNQTNKKGIEIAKKYNMCQDSDDEYFNYSSYRLDNKTLAKPYDKEVKTLTQEKKDKIAQIILDLELGEVNKKELINILENVKF